MKKCQETGRILDAMGLCRWHLPTEKKLDEISFRLVISQKNYRLNLHSKRVCLNLRQNKIAAQSANQHMHTFSFFIY